MMTKSWRLVNMQKSSISNIEQRILLIDYGEILCLWPMIDVCVSKLPPPLTCRYVKSDRLVFGSPTVQIICVRDVDLLIKLGTRMSVQLKVVSRRSGILWATGTTYPKLCSEFVSSVGILRAQVQNRSHKSTHHLIFSLTMQEFAAHSILKNLQPSVLRVLPSNLCFHSEQFTLYAPTYFRRECAHCPQSLVYLVSNPTPMRVYLSLS